MRGKIILNTFAIGFINLVSEYLILESRCHRLWHRDFLFFEPVGVPLRPVFRYKATEGRGGGERRFPCLRESVQLAFRDCAKSGIRALFTCPVRLLPLAPSVMPYRKNFSERKPQAS